MNPDPQELFREPPDSIRNFRFKNALSYLGPGALIASVTIGSGELVMASRSGAIFGYAMLWCFVYSGVFKAVQVYASNRHITLTGEHPIVSWRTLPGPPLWFPIMIAAPTLLLIPIVFSALPEMLGTFIHRLSGLSSSGPHVLIYGYEELWLNIWGSLTLVACLALAIWASFDWVERISTIMLGMMVFCIVVSVFTLGFDLMEIVKGMALPRIPDYEAWITSDPKYQSIAQRSPWLEVSIYLAAVGGGTTSYLGYVDTIREKGWGLADRKGISKETLEAAIENPIQLERARLWTRAPLLDAGISFFFVILVTLLFAILGTVVLHPERLIPDGSELLNLQERYLTLLHPSLSILYRFSVFLAFIGTLFGAFVLYRYTIAAGLAGIFGNRAPSATAPGLRKWVYAYCFIGGIVLIWLPVGITGSIVDRLTFAGLFSGASGCGIWCFAMLWSDHYRVPKALQMGLALRLALVVSGFVLLGLGIRAIIAFFSQ